MHKTLTRSVSYFLVLLSVFMVLPTKSFAAVDVCNPAKQVFNKVQGSFGRDIRETVMNHLISSSIDFTFSTATGVEMSEMMKCTTYMTKDIPTKCGASNLKEEVSTTKCTGTSTTTCESLKNQYVLNPDGTYNHDKFAEGKVAGSLLGMAYAVQNTMLYEPLPVNTAYFFRDLAAKLPVVGDKVLAADESVDYKQPFLESILAIWKITQAIAFALMAIIMLYVGITIILRKQVSQKVVVTVQYSLPKIVTSLLLITFSYPIGALMASLAYSLFHSAEPIVKSIATITGETDLICTYDTAKSLGLIGIVIILILFIFSTGGAGIGLVVLVVLLVVALIILFLIGIFKAFYLYIKMLLGIVTAPLEFAIGAIPGNEDRVMDWFKRMAALGLGIFSIRFIQVLIHLLALQALSAMWDENPLSGFLFAIFGSLFLFIFGYTFAIKAPDQIDKFINGKPQQKR